MEYTVRRSARARRVRVSVDPHAGVQVTLPQRAAEREAALAVAELRPWIERRLRDQHAARERTARPRPGTSRSSARPAPRARAGPHARAPARRRAARARPPTRAPAIERWYRRTARAEVAPRLDEPSPRSGSATRA